MADKKEQTAMYFGTKSKIFSEIELRSKPIEGIISQHIQNNTMPSNDLFLSLTSRLLAQLATLIEDYNIPDLRTRIISLIALLLAWLELLEHNNLNPENYPHKHINNTTYNTILIKLVGQISKLIIQNKNSKQLRERILKTIKYLNLWHDKLHSPKVKPLIVEDQDKLQQFLESFLNEPRILLCHTCKITLSPPYIIRVKGSQGYYYCATCDPKK